MGAGWELERDSRGSQSIASGSWGLSLGRARRERTSSSAYGSSSSSFWFCKPLGSKSASRGSLSAPPLIVVGGASEERPNMGFAAPALDG